MISLTGKRIHISGSADENASPARLTQAHYVVKMIVKNILNFGGGIVLGIGGEPFRESEPKLPIIFDWSILEVISTCKQETFNNWPFSQGAPVILVGFSNWKERIPKHRQDLWAKLEKLDFIELVVIPNELTYGGVLRRVQSKYGDILITLGGKIGVFDSIHIYQKNKKHIIPLDISLNDSKTMASEIHSRRVYEKSDNYFEYIPKHKANLVYSQLSLKENITNWEEYESIFIEFLNNLSKPKAFYVRLMNEKHEDFVDVENYFRNVIDPVMDSSGYEKFESGQDASEEIFLDVEIFRKIYHSTLVMIDMTGVRPNCCIELGFALGLGKKIILTAKDGTKVPFDSLMIPRHCWKTDLVDKERIRTLEEFMRININRNPIVHQEY